MWHHSSPLRCLFEASNGDHCNTIKRSRTPIFIAFFLKKTFLLKKWKVPNHFSKKKSLDLSSPLKEIIVFTSFKIGQWFFNKDPVPWRLNQALYVNKCAGCSACYICETTRHISSCIEEHLKTNTLKIT